MNRTPLDRAFQALFEQRRLTEDAYYHAFARPLPGPCYAITTLVRGARGALIRRRRRQRRTPMPTGNCSRPASR